MARPGRFDRLALLLLLVALAAAGACTEGSRTTARHHAPAHLPGPRQQRWQRHDRHLLQLGKQLRAGVAGGKSVQQHVLVRTDSSSPHCLTMLS